MKVAITQSNYIPWKGYFDGINMVDTFVIYDEMQFTRRDWRNRNLLKTAQGTKWLTIPVEVKGKYFQKISETKISEKEWNKDHWKTISMVYARAPYFKDYKDFFEELYINANSEWLHEVNMHFIIGICRLLGITTQFRNCTEFELKEDRNERLLHICKETGATDYYSGPAAKAYMDLDLFKDANVNVHFFDYSNYPEYKQLYTPFEHSVTILDLLFNTGNQAGLFMKTLKK
jgi:hypothetical protein